jgi:hypothetical protein
MAFHRRFALALLTVSMALVLVAIPLRVTLKGWGTELFLQSAFAKDGNGKGGGNGNGKDGGNGKGQGDGQDGGNGKGSAGKSAGKSASKNAAPDSGRHVNPSSGDVVQVSEANIDVLHRNGMRERIKAGRYLMKDGKGRTIIERRATGADIARLRDMID